MSLETIAKASVAYCFGTRNEMINSRVYHPIQTGVFITQIAIGSLTLNLMSREDYRGIGIVCGVLLFDAVVRYVQNVAEGPGYWNKCAKAGFPFTANPGVVGTVRQLYKN